MVDLGAFIGDLRTAFGDGLKLPVAVWRSHEAAGADPAVPHCMFGALKSVLEGAVVSFSKERLHCGGGRLYCGFAPGNPGIPNFVSLKERYKQTPEMVSEYINGLGIALAGEPYLNLARIDKLDTLDGIDGIFFLAGADILSGLCAWAFFDNNDADAVVCRFGSGCSSVVTNIMVENRLGGRRTFIGMTDPSARPFVGSGELSFAIPMCRLEEMAVTLRDSCVWGAAAWSRLKSLADR